MSKVTLIVLAYIARENLFWKMYNNSGSGGKNTSLKLEIKQFAIFSPEFIEHAMDHLYFVICAGRSI